jgi:Mg-dependent DNase
MIMRTELKICNKKTIKNYKCVAVGEIGIDKHWDLSFLKQQKIAFQSQIDMALETGFTCSYSL